MMEKFEIYYHVFENEAESYEVYYSYEEGVKKATKHLEKSLGRELHIYDIFPNFDHENKPLTSPLSVITKSQQEMFLPAGLEIEMRACSLVLFGYKDEDS